MITLLRASACLVLAAAAFLQLGGTAIAVAPSPEPRAFEPDCNPCVVIVDKAAWDETQTVIDKAAWDETVTVIDVPATTGTKTVIDAPARAVAHHDLVSAAHDVTTSTWVPETTNQLNTTSGAWMDTFVPAVSGLLYMPFSCWWEWDDGGRYRECDGGYYYGAIITPAHYENLWHQGHYVYQAIRECDDFDWGYRCYFAGYGYQWYEGPFWEAVDTSHYAYTTTHYDALYSDWIEQIPALTHTETYPIPAVTHETTVHHAALTHTALVHHDAVTHQEQAPVVLSQSSQGSASGENANVPNASSTTPVIIPVVSTITLIDKPASTRTVTITDAPAYTTQRTVVDQAAYDQAVQRPIYDVECDDNGHCHRYIDDWETIYVHHDAVTHQESVQVPAVTHQETQTVAAVTRTETLRFDAVLADGSSDGDTGGLAAFALIAGLTALAGAGRYASRGDALRAAVANMARLGEPIPVALEQILSGGSAAATNSVDNIVANALITAGDASAGAPTVNVTNPQGRDPRDFRNLSWQDRRDWLQRMQDEHSLGGWLNVFQGVMDYAESSANFKNMDLFKAWDGAVLAHIAEGIDAVYSGVTPTTCAGEQWANFFESLVAQQGRNPSISDDLLKHLWGVAEQQAIEEGKAYAKANSTYSAEDLRMVLTLKGVTDGYRQSARENTGLFGGIGPVQFKVADPRIDRVFIADLAKSAEGVWVNKPKFDELVPPDIDRSTGCVSDPGPASRDWLADFRRGEHNTGPAETGDTGGGSNTVETPDSLADFRRGEHNTGPAETDQTGGPSQSIEVPDLLPNFTAEEHSPGEPTSNDGDGGDGATSDGPATSDIEIAA